MTADFTGDGRADLAVWRPSTGYWYLKGRGKVRWGLPDDIPVPGDFNGDGKAELAVWRPITGEWYIRGHAKRQWGRTGDIPVIMDGNKDGRADIAVYRPSTGTWYSNGRRIQQDWWRDQVGVDALPVPGNFIGDQASEYVTYRPWDGTWHVSIAPGTVDKFICCWGRNGDLPV